MPKPETRNTQVEKDSEEGLDVGCTGVKVGLEALGGEGLLLVPAGLAPTELNRLKVD